MNKLLLSATFSIFSFLAGAQVNFTSSLLPILVINSNGQEIPDEPKLTAQMGLIYNGPGLLNHLTDPFNAWNGPIGIERRGSSSFFYDKKPFTIELRDDAGEDVAASLLGMPEESDFALISPLNDKTLIRDVYSFIIASEIMPWAPRSRFVEVVLNGDYIGVYALVETIKRDANRVNIAKIKETDLSGPELTGGYIIRFDKDDGMGGIGDDWMSNYPPLPGSWQTKWFQHYYPKNVDMAPEQQNYIRNYIRDFEDMMAGPNFETEVENWIDLDSWVNYLLVAEVSKNTDAYRISAYFYKDRDDVPGGGKITMGPVWDFNIAYGIGDYCQGQDPKGWQVNFGKICSEDFFQTHFWWEKIWEHPKFRQRLNERWAELRSTTWTNEKLLGKIDSLTGVIGEARTRNFQRWPVLGTYVWPNAFVGNTYPSEINYMKGWLKDRLEWLDMNIPALQQSSLDATFDLAPALVFPNPVRGKFYVKSDAELFSSSFTVTLFDQLGRQVFEQKYITGRGVFEVDFSTGNLAKGIYTCVIFNRDKNSTYRKQLLIN